MKKYLIILLFSFIVVSADAQIDEMNIKWGDPIPAKRMLVDDILSANNEGEFYSSSTSIKFMGGTRYFQKYNSLKLKKQIELKSDYKRKEYDVEYVIELNDQLYLMNQVSTREKYSLSAQGLNNETLRPSGNREMIYNFKKNKTARYTPGTERSYISPEESKIAYVMTHPGDKKSPFITSVKLFDDNFDLLWDNKIEFDYPKERTHLTSITCSDDGTVYMLLRVTKEKEDQKRNERKYDIVLHTISADGLESSTTLELEDNYIVSLKLNISAEGNLLCGGFYSQEGYQTDGVFYMTLSSEDYSILTTSLKKFDIGFIVEGQTDRVKKKAKKKVAKGKNVGLSHVTFRNIIVKEDGGAVLVGEYVHIYTTTYTDQNGVTKTTTHYNYDDIYVINIDPDGQIEWAKKILKRQHTTNDGGFYSSFFMVVNGEHLNFLFNTRIKRENILNVATLDANGKEQIDELVRSKSRSKMRIRPKSCEQITDNEFIIYAVGKKSYSFARVVLN